MRPPTPEANGEVSRDASQSVDQETQRSSDPSGARHAERSGGFVDDDRRKRSLIVAIRGWSTTGKLSPEFGRALEGSIREARIFRPELEMSFASMRSPESLIDDLFRQIDAEVASMPDLESITLLGFSAGTLLARRAFCRAHGMGPRGEPEHEPAQWASMIDRIVVLSGVTRGWEISTASPANVRFVAPVLLGAVAWYGRWKALVKRLQRGRTSHRETGRPLIFHLRRGAPFVIEARIQYVNVLRRLREQAARLGTRPQLPSERAALRQDGVPSTVFLLGAKDEYVSPADCTELGPRAEFVYLELPGSNHAEAIRITDADEVEGIRAVVVRRERLVAALQDPYARLRDSPWAVPSTDIDDYLDPMDLAGSGEVRQDAGERVKSVVMIVHGIRDHGFWTKRVAREVKRLGREKGIEVRAPTPSYGFLSMWDFVMPGGRSRAAHWFLERYADVRTHFPNATISFVGHSNGTYIAARALEMSPAVELENVVFAGSVVRRSFDWTRFRGRVRRVYNYVSHGDSVVAFLPAVFESLRIAWLDVGGAGAFGFQGSPCEDRGRALGGDEAAVGSCEGEPLVHEMRYVRGGHGAAIGESFWPEVAGFALEGRIPERRPCERPTWLRALYRLAPVFTLLGMIVAVLLLTLPVLVATWIVVEASETSWAAWTRGALVIAVVAALGVSWITRRFLHQW